MEQKLKIAVIGLGARGQALLRHVLIPMAEENLEIAGVCDLEQEKINWAVNSIKDATGHTPYFSTNYHEILQIEQLDAVLVLTGWQHHFTLAADAMKACRYVGVEVGCAYSMEEIYDLIHIARTYQSQCMMLENCCYGRREMMIWNMVQKGVFGEVVHCAGGYCHDLREEIASGKESGQYRYINYLKRNCENYPTHELGPIMRILNINHGNRMITLCSSASPSRGMNAYLRTNDHFTQGDVVTTNIRCSGGQTITLTLDTTLPRPYSRGFSVAGTKARYFEDNDSLFIDGIHNADVDNWRDQWGNASEFEEQYEHSVWKSFRSNIRGGHGGMDWLVLDDFFSSVRKKNTVPIDIFDTATLLSISLLSEQSIALGGQWVAVPDFTNGKWMQC